MRTLTKVRLRYSILFFIIGFLACYFGYADYRTITLSPAEGDSTNQLSFNYLESLDAAELFENLKHEEVAVLYEDSDYGNTMREHFKAEFKKRGGSIIKEIGFPKGTTSFEGILEVLKNKEVRAVYLISGPEDGAKILSKASDLGIKGDIIATSTIKDAKLIEEAKESAEGLIIIGTKDSVENNYVSYQQILTDPEISAFNYDSLKLLAYTTDKCDSNEISNKLVALRNFIKTGSGKEKPYTVYIVDQGKFVDYEG